MGIIIGVIVVLLVAAFLAVLTCKSKKCDLFKWVGIVFFIAILLTWIIPTGAFQGGEFAEGGLIRLGLSDIPVVAYYAIYFCLTTVVLLLVIGGFYGVLTHTKSYKKLVNSLANFVGRDKLTTIISTIVTMLVLYVLTAILKSPLCLVVFLPFIASVFINAKVDKLTTMGITFGSVLVGLLGAIWGTDGLYWFNTYLSISDNPGIGMRAIIGGCAIVLFILFNVFRINDLANKSTKKAVKKTTKAVAEKKTTKKVKEEVVVEEVKETENKDDLFNVENTKVTASSWKAIFILALTFVLVVLAFFNWTGNLEIKVFDDFFTWLTELKIGEDFTIFSYILGTSSVAFGAMELTSLISILLIVTIIYALMSELTLTDACSAFGEGFAKMFKPTVLYVLTYAVFIVLYMSPYLSYVNNWALGLTDSFNPYITTVTAFITNIFHADLGYTGYLVGTTYNMLFTDSFELIHTIFLTTYGLVQLFMPTGGILLIGLAYFKIDYKEWFKYIWLFVVAVVFILLILATVVTYIM